MTDEVGPDGLATLTIDLAAVAENWRHLAALAAPAECAGVVKADAYGCGIEAVVPALARTGCKTFFTAHVAEGRRTQLALRRAGQEGRIFVLNGFHPGATGLSDYLDYQLGAVLGSMDELTAWEEARAQGGAFQGLTAALHVDTGMNRLGFPIDEARSLGRPRLIEAGIAFVMSHLVSAENPAEPVNRRQIAVFDHARQGDLEAFPASLCNSSGIFLPQHPVYDLVRPGYALYGGNPTPGAPNPMRPVVSLKARILQLRSVPAGASVGYSGRWTAPRASRLATLGIGYADGLPIGASGIDGRGAAVRVAGLPCPVVGRVSMDLTVVDVTDVPEADIGPGTPAEWLGPHIGVDELGRQAGTIGYEILTGLGRRYQRRYKGGDLPGPAPC